MSKKRGKETPTQIYEPWMMDPSLLTINGPTIWRTRSLREQAVSEINAQVLLERDKEREEEEEDSV